MYRCLLRSLPVLMLLTVLSLAPALSGDACREMTTFVGPTCALADEAPQKADDKADAKKDDKAQDKKSGASAPAEAEAAPTVDPLENIWAGQKDMLDDINSSTRGLVRDINKQAETMSKQARPIIGEEFIGDDSVAMVLGDNIFFGHGLNKRLKAAVENAETGKGATVFGYYVDDPERFGIVEFDSEGKAISIEEKPEKPKSNYCVTGLYFYDNKVVEYAKNLKPSPRGELEITDLNRIYLEDGSLNVELLGQGFTWLDTGTHESLVEATNFVKTIETHQHRKIACLEEIGYLNGWIGKDQLLTDIEPLKKNQYGQYLMDVMNGKYIDK